MGSGDRGHESGQGPPRDSGRPAPGAPFTAAARPCDVRRALLTDASGTSDGFEKEAVARRLADGTFFWLDLRCPDQRDMDALGEAFHFHPLALEDSRQFGERPKLDDYGEYGLLVVYGVNAHLDELVELVEVHCFIAQDYLITIHRVPCPTFDAVRRWFAARPQVAHAGWVLTYHVADSLVDSFFPVLADFDDRIDTLEDDVFVRPDDEQLQEVLRMKRGLVALRKVVTPQRDLCARLVNGALTMPGSAPSDEAVVHEAERYYRDLYDHLIRISDLIDTCRDLMTGTMDVYLSTVQNRMDSVMKKLTLIATIFLPLTWLTGFFGMNFAFMVEGVRGWQAFLLMGIGTQMVAVIVLLWLLKRRRWM